MSRRTHDEEAESACEAWRQEQQAGGDYATPAERHNAAAKKADHDPEE